MQLLPIGGGQRFESAQLQSLHCKALTAMGRVVNAVDAVYSALAAQRARNSITSASRRSWEVHVKDLQIGHCLLAGNRPK